MSVDYLKELLGKQNDIDEVLSSKEVAQEDDLDGLIGDIESLGEEEPIMSEEPIIEPPKDIEFDGSLQSHPDDNKYANLLDDILNKTPVEEPIQSVGIPAEISQESTVVPEVVEPVEPTITPEAVEPKTDDIIEMARQIKKSNPDIPLSELMKQAKDASRKREADLLYQRAMLEALDVGETTKVDKSHINSQLEGLDKSYNQDVAIAAQKNKENQEKTINDPNSDISKTMKRIAKQLGIEIGSDMTAKELMNAGLKMNTLVSMKSNRDVSEFSQNMKAKLNEAKDEQRIAKDSQKIKAENKKYFLDMEQRVGALKRGSSFKDLDTKLNAVAEMRLKLDQALSGKVPLNRASAVDLSAVWSKALTGGIPAQGLIEQTLPISMKSDFARAVNYLANEPVTNFISKKNLELMNNQLKVLEQSVNIRKGEKLASVYNSYNQVINSDPQFKEIIKRNYGKYVAQNKDGYFEPTKSLTKSGAETGKKQGSIMDRTQESMISKVMDNAKIKGIQLTRQESIEYLKSKGKL